MARVDTKTPILHIFHEKYKNGCLGVLYIYTAIVFCKTPLDTTIYSNVSQYGLSKTPIYGFPTILTKGGVYSD
jgi:hypothetical protein